MNRDYVSRNKDKKSLWDKKYRERNIDKLIKIRSKYKKDNRLKVNSANRKYRKENRDKALRWTTKWLKNNPEWLKAREKKAVSELNDSYVRKLLKRQIGNNKRIDDELLEIKKTIIQIKRKIKQHGKQDNNKNDNQKVNK